MLEPHVPEELTSYIVEAYVALREQSGLDAKNGDQVGGPETGRGGGAGGWGYSFVACLSRSTIDHHPFRDGAPFLL